jgi:hypothetical protein
MVESPDKIEAGAPEDTSTVITPEMMRAGVSAYRNRDSRFDRDRDVVEEIFTAMMAAAPVRVGHSEPAERTASGQPL